jgi:enoyl-CoA hydratase/carnithine racemase
MSAHLDIKRDGRVQVIRFNRPDKKNALTGEMYDGMTAALNGASEQNIAVTVFFGHPGIFCAGNDLFDFMRAASDGQWTLRAFDFLHALVDSQSAIMAGVDGSAIGIGTTLMMHCDMAFATPRAVFQTPFVNLGLVPEAGSSLIGPRLMGHVRAFELLVMGERFDAHRALHSGLINRVVEPEALEPEVLKAAHALAEKPREAVALSRRLLKGDPAEVKKRIDEEVKLFAERLRSPEAAMAVQAFLSKPAKG